MYILQQKLQLPLLRGSVVLWLNIIAGWKHKQIRTVSLKGDMTVALVLTIARSTITCSNSSKDYSITEQLGLEGPLVLSNCPAQSRVCYCRLLMAVHSGFAASKDGNATISLGNLFQCLITLPVEKPIVPYTEVEFPVFQSVPIACCPVTRHHQERLGSTPPFLLPHQVFISNDKIPLAPLLQAEQSQLSQPSLI